MKISNKAIERIREIKVALQAPDAVFYLKVLSGGCSGLTYKAEIVSEYPDEDIVNNFGDVSVVIEKRSIFFISNIEIDYEEGLLNSGFKFNVPSSRTCGCGESFVL